MKMAVMAIVEVTNEGEMPNPMSAMIETLMAHLHECDPHGTLQGRARAFAFIEGAADRMDALGREIASETEEREIPRPDYVPRET